MRNYTLHPAPQNTRNNPAKNEVGDFISYTEIHKPDTFPVVEYIVRGTANIVSVGADVTGIVAVETIKVVGTIILAIIVGFVELAKTAIVEWSKPRVGQWDGERSWDDSPNGQTGTFGNINITINQNTAHYEQ